MKRYKIAAILILGTRHFCNKLHYNNGVDDIYAASRNYGRNIFL